MKQHPEIGKRWNLFARTLDDMLCARGYDLNDLIRKAGLHSEKVRRLKQSLAQPKFHILNPEELEQVSLAFALTGKEQLCLRAAILATAVEETLMNRIDPDSALSAAEEIFPLLVEALQQRYGRLSSLAAVRRTGMSNEALPVSEVLEPILASFDQAMLAFHLSRQSQTKHERLAQAILARDRFTGVLAELDAVENTNPAMREDDAWQLWHQETQNNLVMVQEDLRRLQE